MELKQGPDVVPRTSVRVAHNTWIKDEDEDDGCRRWSLMVAAAIRCWMLRLRELRAPRSF